MFAAMSIVTDIALDTIDWLPLMIMARGFNAILSVAILLVLARRGGRSAEPPADAPSWSQAKVALAIVVAATLDVLGLISFVIGLETAPTWMVGLASSFGPAVTIIAAVAFLGERLKPIQWAGLGGDPRRDDRDRAAVELISRRSAAPARGPCRGTRA